jgi:hypothetical protein
VVTQSTLQRTLTRGSRRVHRALRTPGFEIMRLLGRFSAAREASRWYYRPVDIEPYLRRPTLFPDLDVRGVVAALDRTGLALGLRLPLAVVAEVLTYAHTTPCYGNGDVRLGFLYSDRTEAEHRAAPMRFVLGQFYNASRDCAPIRRLADDGALWAIAASYLRARPALQGANLWWSFAGEASERDRNAFAQMYHFDTDDYRFVKFFFYLTDVDSDGGPHAMVTGTHRHKRLRHQLVRRRFTDDEIEQAYGRDRMVMITGGAGAGFAEDTGCIHKGIPPRTRDRLALQVEFGLRNYSQTHDERPPSQLRRLV